MTSRADPQAAVRQAPLSRMRRGPGAAIRSIVTLDVRSPIAYRLPPVTIGAVEVSKPQVVNGKRYHRAELRTNLNHASAAIGSFPSLP